LFERLAGSEDLVWVGCMFTVGGEHISGFGVWVAWIDQY
jgi:hypothetical protein